MSLFASVHSACAQPREAEARQRDRWTGGEAIDPHKIGVIGFSAGGHLVAAISNDWQKRLYPPIDEADRQSARRDFAITLYPGHLWRKLGIEFIKSQKAGVTASFSTG